MTVAALLQELHQLGIRIEIRDDRLYCATSKEEVPVRLQKVLSSRRKQLLVRLRQDRKREDRGWIITPDGPGKIWGFLPKGRVGIVLRSDIMLKPEGERSVRFYKTRHIRPFTSEAMIFCVPPPDPDEGKWRTEATRQFKKITVPRIDGKGVDEWMVGRRLDKPGEYQFWALRPAVQNGEEESMEWVTDES